MYWVSTCTTAMVLLIVVRYGPNTTNGQVLHGESHTRLGSLLVSGIPALRLFGDQRCTIVPILRLFIDAALLITIALIARYDCIRNPCILLGVNRVNPSPCTEVLVQLYYIHVFVVHVPVPE